MALIDTIADMLGGENGELVRINGHKITEIRLRTGRRMRLDCLDGEEIGGETLDGQTFHRLINRLMDNSLYAREAELRQGYFTALEGCRVGVCGKINAGRDRVENLANIASACIRIPREVRGCAKMLFERIYSAGLRSALIISPPGMGKTTLLRDLIRMISDGGYNVAVADERREIASCLEGVPQLDVGCRTDVLDGCMKAIALPMMIRACAPQMVAADEIGSAADADALREAARCGIAVIATAHGANLRDVMKRENIGALLREGIFDACILLGPGRGEIRQIQFMRRGADEGFDDAQRCSAVGDPPRLCGGGTDAVQCPQAEV